MPAIAARAQAGFDCWMQEQEENWQQEDIAACKKGFMAALAKLEAKPKKAARPRPRRRARRPKPKPLPFYKINFGFNSAKLDGKARGVVKSAAATISKHKVKMVLLNGHTDRSGSGKYNARLSKARSASVAKALLSAGVSGSIIRTKSYGETWNLVTTSDGKREAANRRVDILMTR